MGEQAYRQTSKPPCEYCGSPADLFDPQGRNICQACDSRFRADAQQRIAAAQGPVANDLTFASPGKLMLIGGAMMAGAAVLFAVEYFLVGRVHLVLIGALFIAGFGALARGGMG